MDSLDQKHGNHLKELAIKSFPQNCYESLGYLSLAAEYLYNDLQTLEWKIKCLFELKQYRICLKNINENQYQSQEILKIQFQIYLDLADFDSILNVSKRKLRIDDNATRQLYKTLKKIARFYNSYLLQEQKCMQLIKQGNQRFPKDIEIQQLQRKIGDQFFHYKMSKLCLQYRKYSEVVRACKEGLKIDPQNTKLNCLLMFNRGKAQKQLGNLQQALQDFDAVLNIDESLIECIQQRIYVYVGLKKYHLAIFEYRLLKVKDPANQATYDQLIGEIQKLDFKVIKEGEVCKTVAIIPFEQFNPPQIQSEKMAQQNIAVHQKKIQCKQQQDEDQQDQQEQADYEYYEEYQNTQQDDSDDYLYDPDIRVSVPKYRPGVQKIKQK